MRLHKYTIDIWQASAVAGMHAEYKENDWYPVKRACRALSDTCNVQRQASYGIRENTGPVNAYQLAQRLPFKSDESVLSCEQTQIKLNKRFGEKCFCTWMQKTLSV